MESFSEHQKVYRQQHSTLGCKVTHMVGVPLITLSLPLFLINWQIATALFVVGWILQLIGHFVFEKNTPVFFGNPLNPLTYMSALVFVGGEWARFLSGKPLTEPAVKNS